MFKFKDVKESTGLKLDQYHTILSYLGIEWKVGKGKVFYLTSQQYNSIVDIVKEHGIGVSLSSWIKEQNSIKKYGLKSPNQLKEKREHCSLVLKEKVANGEKFGFIGMKIEERWNYKTPEQKAQIIAEKQRNKYGENWEHLTAPEKTKITQTKNNIYFFKNIERKRKILANHPGYVIWHDTKWQKKDFLISLIKSEIIKDFLNLRGVCYIVSEKEINDNIDEIDKLFIAYQKRCRLAGKSYQEDEIANFLDNNKISYERHVRKIIYPKELDFYIENKKVAIEFDGLYWHSEDKVGNTYHLEKTEACQEKGIRLIHIFEDEWYNKRNIVESIILSACGIYKEKIFARKCSFKEISIEEGNKFINENHIAGSIKAESKFYALIYNGEIKQCIQIGANRFDKGTIELLRMCTKLNTEIVGGFSKLMKNQPFDNIISYVDRSLFNGNGYNSSGWEIIDVTKPAYFYFKSGENRKNRLSFQKHKLEKILENFDPALTEKENMKNNGYSRIFNCGNYKLIWRKNNE